MITVFLSLCIVIVFMHFAHELEEKLSTMYNYTAIQTEQEDPNLFATIKTHKQLVWNATYHKNIYTILKPHYWKSFPFTLPK